MTRLLMFVLSLVFLGQAAYAQHSEIIGRRGSPVMLAREPRPLVPRNQASPSRPVLETCGQYLDRVIASDGKTPMIRYFFRLDNGQIAEEMFKPSNMHVEESFTPYSITNDDYNHPRIQQFVRGGTIVVYIKGNYQIVDEFHTCWR